MGFVNKIKKAFNEGIYVPLPRIVTSKKEIELEKKYSYYSGLCAQMEEVAARVISSRTDGKKTEPVAWNYRIAIACYHRSPWVQACIDWLSSSASSIEWVLKKRDADGNWNKVTEKNPVTDFLKNPNPVIPANHLWHMLVQHMYLTGDAFCKKVKTDGTLREWWPLLPEGLKVIKRNDGRGIEALVLPSGDSRKDGEKVVPKDFTHFYFPSPSDPFLGQSPLEAGLNAAECDLDFQNWQKGSIENGCKKDGVFTFDHDLTEDAFIDISRLLHLQVYGNNNGRSPLIMGHNAKYTPLDLSPAEMDYISSRKFIREQIASIFRVPLSMLGIEGTGSINSDALDTYRVVFWEDTVIPVILDNFAATMNLNILPEFREYAGGDYKIEYDLTSVPALLKSYERKAQVAKIMTECYFPINDTNDRLNLGYKEVEGGGSGYIQSQFMPLGYLHESIIKQEEASSASPTITPRDKTVSGDRSVKPIK